jgi:hypothetical protein
MRTIIAGRAFRSPPSPSILDASWHTHLPFFPDRLRRCLIPSYILPSQSVTVIESVAKKMEAKLWQEN